MKYDIMIIGAGASGLAAAISAKRTSPRKSVAVLEALPRVGKKILATGNGRCNLTNKNAVAEAYSNSSFAAPALKEYPSEKVIDFFRLIGVMCVNDAEGRVYPMSYTASTVLDALRNEAQRLGAELICDRHIDSVKAVNGHFTAEDIKADKVIICTGGKASASQGSDGSGYTILKGLGHRITDVRPGLVQLVVDENTKSLKGVRVKANVILEQDEKIVDSAKGEVLFTDYGLSGISVMDVSRSVKKGKYVCRIDMLPECDFVEAKNFILSLEKSMPIVNALGGMLPKKATEYVLKSCGINCLSSVGALGERKIDEIIKKSKAFPFTVNSTRGFANAQISVGGANVNEFNPTTLESKLVKGLYCAGEVLDVDSVCGGFNLQWAWASGLAAGKHAALSEKER